MFFVNMCVLILFGREDAGLAQHRAPEPLQCRWLHATPSGLSLRQAGLCQGADPGRRPGEHCRSQHAHQQESQCAQ